MTIARATGDDGSEMLLLGLAKGNIERLMAGKPIKLQSSTHPGIPKGWVISIVYGEPEEIHRQLKAAGVITAETKIEIDPRLK